MIRERGAAPAHAVSLWSCMLSVWVMLLLTCHTRASTDSQHLTDDPDIFEQQMSTDPQRGAGLFDAADSEHRTSRPQRLTQLFLMKNSLKKLLSPAQSASYIGGDLELENATDDNGRDLDPPARKRVFCNGFTGCGGRFRAQRRQGLRNKDKRVFCNSQGCFNGGRKRAMAESQLEDADNVDMELWRKALKRLEELQQWEKMQGMSKRLFCNNYGGCQNLGKRRHSRVDEARSRTAAGLPKLDFSSNRPLYPQKRFFAGNFDSQMDDLSSALRDGQAPSCKGPYADGSRGDRTLASCSGSGRPNPNATGASN